MPDVEQRANGILGEYRIERRLGQSQLGAAYLALEPARGRKALVTTFNFPEKMPALEREQVSARFAFEGAKLVRLFHPHILPIYASGAQPDYLYLVTAFVKEASLGQVLKQQTRFTPEQTLHILRQLAEGLDYAHSQGITHGMLSLANVIVDNNLHAHIAGFGVRTLMEMHGNTRNPRPLEHLTSPLGVFLGNPEYISPERVLGLPINERADIYALGIMLFTLLSGRQPFHGESALETALQRLQQPAPLIHTVCPDVPEAFDLVLKTLLSRDPAKRVQRAGDAVVAFERVVKALETARNTGHVASYAAPEAPVTLQPTVNWFDDQVTPSGKWQVAPPLRPQQRPAAPSSSAPGNASSLAEDTSDSLAGIDPFVWWSSTANSAQKSPAPGTFSGPSSAYLGTPGGRARPRPDQQERRKLVKLIAVGTAAAGALTVSGISFAHFLHSVKQAPSADGSSMMAIGSTSSKDATRGTQKPSQPTPRPTRGTQPPPGHTGTVIGRTSQAKNSAISFKNPADGGGSLLIRRADGNFVACERSCTHQGVPVNYDPGRKLLVCPAHGAIFDPQRNFAHISGPGNGPLARVPVHTNGDGTVTVS